MYKFYLIKKENKEAVNQKLKEAGFKAKWKGDFLVVSETKEDEVFDILCDNALL